MGFVLLISSFFILYHDRNVEVIERYMFDLFSAKEYEVSI